MIRHSFRKLSIQTIASILLLFAISAPTVAATEGRYQPKNHINVGLGFSANSGIFEGQSDQYNPLPLIDIYFNKFFVKQNITGYQVGWEMLSQKDFALFFAAQHDSTHLDIGDINSDSKDLYLGIENDRDREWEIGLVMQYHSKVGLVEAHYFKGFNNDLETAGFLKVSREISETGRLSIIPGMFINYKSDEFNRYYYGVSDAENERGADLANRPREDGTNVVGFDTFRPIYSPGNSGHFGVDLEISYRYAKNLSFWTYLAVEDITGPVEMSPLVEEKSIFHLKAGLVYNFID